MMVNRTRAQREPIMRRSLLRFASETGKRWRAVANGNGATLLLSLSHGLGMALTAATIATISGVVAVPENARAQTQLARSQKYSFNPALNRLDSYTSADVRPRTSALKTANRLSVIVDLPQTSWNARGGLAVYPQGRPAFNTSAPSQSLGNRPSSELCDPVPRPETIGQLPQAPPTMLAYPLAVAAPMSSGFGYRTHPVTGAYSFHEGIDLAAPTGTPILAALSGEVTFAGARGNLGNAVILDHTQRYRTRYGHMEQVVVRAGDRVRQGQLIGYVGSTGRSTGPHLHFEYLRQNPDGGWIALDPQAQVLAATPSGPSSPLTDSTDLAIGGSGGCDRP